MSSMTGIGKWHLFNALFKGLGSRQRRRLPLAFLVITTEFTHSVGLSTFSITPLDSRSSRYSLSGVLKASGTLLNGCWTGLTVSSTSSRNGVPRLPRPSKTSSYLEHTCSKVSPSNCRLLVRFTSTVAVEAHSAGPGHGLILSFLIVINCICWAVLLPIRLTQCSSSTIVKLTLYFLLSLEFVS